MSSKLRDDNPKGSNAERLLAYDEVLGALGGSSRKYLLLGNGFSIACDVIFSYPSLFEAAKEQGLSERAGQVFERLGTNNFEGVMHLLDDADWVARVYDLLPKEGASALQEDVAVVKKTLVDAIAASHLEHPGLIPEDRKKAALAFLQPYHSVFTTNYDLLLYWVNMSASGGPKFRDGFGSDADEPDAETVVFNHRLGSERGLFYLHGALHLYLEDGVLHKHCWCRTGVRLIDQIRTGLELQRYPLFVSEGSPEKKLEQINRVGYLWYGLQKLRGIESPLVVFGHALGPSDQHILDTIADNTGIKVVYIGIHGNLESRTGQATQVSAEKMQARRAQRAPRKPLEVRFFDSRTARPWG